MSRRFLFVACLALVAHPACSLNRAPLMGAEPVDGGLDAPLREDVPVERDAGPDAPPSDGGPDVGLVDGGPGNPLGTACASGATCASGHCADGVCCDTACDGPCEGCTTGIDGTCGAALSGSDPEDDCPTQTADTCGTTGVCDGARACARHPVGTVCGPSSCAAGVQTLPPTCSAAGMCATSGTMACTMGCDGLVCAGSCVDDAACSGARFCNVATGACVPLLGNGAPSSVAAHCASGIVADGVCCDAACGGPCVSCLAAATGTTDGDCQASTVLTDPDGDCAASAAATCGTTGTCNGAGACALHASGTVCAPPSCTGSIETVADTCNGAGACVDAMTRPCDPFVCGASACRTSCSLDAHCMAGRYCDTLGACIAQRALGQSCMRPGECSSGFCADGVCCTAACGGLCEACTVASRGGGPANGTCAPVVALSDPAMECSASASATCGTTGSCDGARACALHPSGTVCAPASCGASTLSLADTCNGSGMCVDGGATSCAPYACAASGTACRTTCTTIADCALGGSCDTGTGTCRTPQPNGTLCGVAAECGSGFCVDGVCCDAACSGTCVACTAAIRGGGVDGVCAPIVDGLDPAGECPTDPVSSCDDTGSCNGAGACALYSGGTVCAAASCTGSTFSGADLCNGTGTCTDAGTSSCAPYACDAAGLACRTSCTSDAACTAASYCDVPMSVCRPRQANGAGCMSANQCTSGICVDGVCCNAACGGTCVSCAVGGMVGTCTNVPVAVSDPGTCVAPLACNGSGACVRPNGQACTLGTECLSGHCVDLVCCNTTCGGTCFACDLGGTLGTCTVIPDGTDPDAECNSPSSRVCDGSGGCRS